MPTYFSNNAIQRLRTHAPHIHVHPDVQKALAENKPVVALESTIIAHGMPYPQNLQNALALERAVSVNGAIPATVAVIHGVPRIGLTESQLKLLATNASVRKLARRDLPSAFANRHHGATTVSATMFLSASVGIHVFATGGIGGVHRNVVATFDISADLGALATIPQLVVCAGAKSILDIPKTLEALETASVPVLVLDHHAFPAFYTRDSGEVAPERVQSEEHAARLVHAARETGAASGMLLAVPVPKRFEADAALVQAAIEGALHELEDENLRPNQVTPFLLKRIAELTDGASLTSNMHLAQHNACVAARVAVHLSRLQSAESLLATVKPTSEISIPQQPVRAPRRPKRTRSNVLVVGGTALDIHCNATKELIMHSSNPGRIRQCAGGVGKNVAEAAAVLGEADVTFVSCVGDDIAGRAVISSLEGAGLPTCCIRQYKGKRTGICCVVHDEAGDLTIAVADFEEMFESTQSFVEDAMNDIEQGLRSAKVACIDANFSAQDMRLLVQLCKKHDVACWFEPTSSVKCTCVVEAGVLRELAYMSPNESELRRIAAAMRKAERGTLEPVATGRASSRNETDLNTCNVDGGDGALAACAEQVLRAGEGLRIVCTRGKRGVTVYSLSGTGAVQRDEYAAMRIPAEKLRNTTGAGDCFAGRCIAGLARGESEDVAIREGIAAAGLCCMSDEIVPRQRKMAKL